MLMYVHIFHWPNEGCTLDIQRYILLGVIRRTISDRDTIYWMLCFLSLCFAQRFDFRSISVVDAASITFYTYPAIPDDSILFANSTSFEYTSYCLRNGNKIRGLYYFISRFLSLTHTQSKYYY